MEDEQQARDAEIREVKIVYYVYIHILTIYTFPIFIINVYLV